MIISEEDRIATIAACSSIGSLERSSGRAEPLGPSEWSEVAQWLHGRGERPANLLDPDLAGATGFAGIHPKIASRLLDLPARCQAVALELERNQNQGIWSLVRFDDAYPAQWREKLKSLAPPVLFGAGRIQLLSQSPSLAIVGSRDIGPELSETALNIGRRAAAAGYLVVSGGARGSDRWGMLGALQDGRNAVGILHGDLLKDASKRDTRRFIQDGHLCLISHVHPATGFVTGNAMARNRYIHAFATATIVISTAAGSGGTWAGSVDNLEKRWSPLLVWSGAGAPEGNTTLIAEGGFPFDEIPYDRSEFESLIAAATSAMEQRERSQPQPVQKGLAL